MHRIAEITHAGRDCTSGLRRLGQTARSDDRLSVVLEGASCYQRPGVGKAAVEDLLYRTHAYMSEANVPGIVLRSASDPAAELTLAVCDDQLKRQLALYSKMC